MEFAENLFYAVRNKSAIDAYSNNMQILLSYNNYKTIFIQKPAVLLVNVHFVMICIEF